MVRYILIVAAVALASGCRSDPYAEVREREWRRLEDEIYNREDAIADLEAQLESCRRENDTLRRRGGTSEPTEPLPLPKSDSPRDVPPELLDDFRPPKTDLGTEAPPPLGRAAPRRPRAILLAGGSRASSWRDTPVRTSGGSQSPAVSLKFNRRLTGGNNTDHREGDEGILAVVEARDAAGELVASPGEMTLALYDPLASGDRSVVAQWDFTADEVAARFREGPFGSGTLFELPWPNRPPRRPNLRLQVSCRTAGGRALSADHKFAVELPHATALPHAAAAATGAEAAASGKPKPHGEHAAASDSSGDLPPWRPTRQ
ncbi:MAG: hypothetical protein WD875_18960 [Pirellulales bacterium]